jgi:arsenate reductase
VAQVYCYSGGSTQTALYPKIAETLIDQGFSVHKMMQSANPVYAVKYSENTLPIIAFSKLYNSPYNPESGFSAIMTCTQAEKACPFIPGAAHRISIPFEDPKIADLSADQTKVYAACSLQIAAQMFYVFSRIKK